MANWEAYGPPAIEVGPLQIWVHGYHSHIERFGKSLYQRTCERNLEGIVCKPRSGLYETRRSVWVKVKNPSYTQAVGREELFEELRG